MARKVLALALALLMVAALAACGGGAGSTAGTGGSPAPAGGGDKVTVTYWAHLNEGWNASHRALVEKFNASQDAIEVKTEFFPYDDFESKTQTSLMQASGGADLYELWGGWAPDFNDTGALAKVPEYISDTFTDDYYPSALGSFEYEGDYYGVPLEFNIENGGLFVNKVQFDAQGLTYPTTWDEMIDIAVQTSVGDGVVMDMRGFDFVGNDSTMYILTMMMLSSGTQYQNEDGTFNFASPAGVEAMTELVHYVNDLKITNLDALTGGGDVEGIILLFEDRAMQVMRGPWALSEGVELYDAELGVTVDYIEMPWYGPEKAFAAETGWGLGVASSSPNQEAAWTYVDFMLEEDNLIDHLIACGMVPPRKSLIDNEKYIEAMPHVVPLLGILEYGQYLGHFNTDVLKEEVAKTLVALCTTSDYATVEDGMKDLDARLNDLLL